MIVRTYADKIVMTEQHNHALLAGELASQLRHPLYGDSARRDEVLLAIRQHDRGWRMLDETPVWNDREELPFSFQDYPMLPKLLMYKSGIDEVEAMNGYAGLLCSMYYSSFEPIRKGEGPGTQAFYNTEMERQERLSRWLGYPDRSLLAHHYDLLQLCDGLSLYICFNEPGVSKEDEHPWYREAIGSLGGVTYAARWAGKEEVVVTPSPFARSFRTTIRSKRISMDARRRLGIGEAYKQAPYIEQTVCFTASP
ncbi:DUF3891 family protein [Paenibacillus sp. 1P07SE]|uniref:DUF3891 family protein n=1 Tax=Paenibacillus sp. 1P07SE TaxID=3132209 RepID=UPI0039A47E3D